MTVEEVINKEKGDGKYVIGVEKNGFNVTFADTDIEIFKRMDNVFSSLFIHEISDYFTFQHPKTQAIIIQIFI